MLAKLRPSVALYELQGDLVFATAEKAHRTIVADLDDVEYVVIDFRYVTSIDEPSRGGAQHARRRRWPRPGAPSWPRRIPTSGSTPSSRAESAELPRSRRRDRMVRGALAPRLRPRRRPDGRSTQLEDFDLLDGLGDAELDGRQRRRSRVRELDAGTVVFREGDVADSMFFLLSGRVNVLLPLDRAPGRPEPAARRRSARVSPSARWRCSTRAAARPTSCATSRVRSRCCRWMRSHDARREVPDDAASRSRRTSPGSSPGGCAPRTRRYAPSLTEGAYLRSAERSGSMLGEPHTVQAPRRGRLTAVLQFPRRDRRSFTCP